MVNRRIGLFPSKPGVHVISTAFDKVDERATDVITGGNGNSKHTHCTYDFANKLPQNMPQMYQAQSTHALFNGHVPSR